MKPLPIATLLCFARDLNDLARAKWERAVAYDPETMTRVVMRADRHELCDAWFFSREQADALLDWREAFEADAREKREDEQGRLQLHIDKPAPQK